MNKKLLLTAACCLAAATSARANLIGTATVQYVDVNPRQTVTVTTPDYSGGAYAGIYNLLVNGTPTDSFCIDVLNNTSTSALVYDVYTLDEAPTGGQYGASPGMGTTAANTVELLWGQNYSPTMSAANAAGLQVAIWKVVSAAMGVSFSVSGNDYGAQNMIDTLDPNGPQTTLVGLVNPNAQSFAIMPAPIPEPSTYLAAALLLIPFGLSTVRVLRRNRMA